VIAPDARAGAPGSSLYETLAPAVSRAAPRLTDAERRVVSAELEVLRGLREGDALEQARAAASRVRERLYDDSASVLLRMHAIAGTGTYESCRSSLAIVRACHRLGIRAGARGRDDVELVVGRGHIAPVFYAEDYVDGLLPFALLATLHHGLTGIVDRRWGFGHTMRYSLGVGIAQAVSRAWSIRQRGENTKVVVLAGDGELHEGIAAEALRFAEERRLDNLVLVVDANGRGIDPLPRPLAAADLASFFARDAVAELDGEDVERVAEALENALKTERGAALVCRTTKGAHSFANPGARKSAPFSKRAGTVVRDFAHERNLECAVFTADMASRFGLADLPHVNVSLAETLGVGLTLGLPDHVLKIVATDDKYFLDSINMLTEASTTTSRVVLLAGKSWSSWGGATNALNLLSRVTNARVYEPVCEGELRRGLLRALERPDEMHVLSLIDAEVDAPPWVLADLDRPLWVVPPAGRRTAVVTFGYAGTLVAAANRDGHVAHLHSAALRPVLTAGDVRALRAMDALLAIEYNAVQDGLGTFLRAEHLLPIVRYGPDGDAATCVHELQLEHFGMDRASIGRRIAELARAGISAQLT
jgi:transketolase